jgi:hypothetical protein
MGRMIRGNLTAETIVGREMRCMPYVVNGHRRRSIVAVFTMYIYMLEPDLGSYRRFVIGIYRPRVSPAWSVSEEPEVVSQMETDGDLRDDHGGGH